MRELLTRWHELEPERCHIGPPTGLICAEVFAGGTFHSVFWREPSYVQLQFLLAAVIEAIEARDWTFALVRVNRAYDASVARPHWTDTGNQTSGASTPAAALLSAYVAALEAEGT